MSLPLPIADYQDYLDYTQAQPEDDNPLSISDSNDYREYTETK